jgi:cyanophycinase
MKEIAGTGLDELIRTRHQAGVIVGGTSAGAAILSKVMITGEADLKNITVAKTITADGLGLATAVIFDQHFLQRQRGNRLISAVLDHRSLVGIGIDESTIPAAAPGAVDSGTDLALHVLRAGMSMNLAR